MTHSNWLDEMPALGDMPPDQAAAKLRAIGETEVAEALERLPIRRSQPGTSYALSDLWPFGKDRPVPLYLHNAHAFGYLATAAPGGTLLPIRHVGDIAADQTLKNSRVKITLDGLRAAAYPGGGQHQVLFTFNAQNQVADRSEDAHFSAIYPVMEGEQAALIGYPIFVGLNIGTAGIKLNCSTINVANRQDKDLLGFLDSTAFKSGLRLVSTLQPAIAPLSETLLGLTKSILKRNENVVVQNISMGIDFSNIAVGARLAEGSYLAVQIPQTLQLVWEWDEWVYSPASGQVVHRDNPKQLIPYNYLIFSISRYEGN